MTEAKVEVVEQQPKGDGELEDDEEKVIHAPALILSRIKWIGAQITRVGTIRQQLQNIEKHRFYLYVISKRLCWFQILYNWSVFNIIPNFNLFASFSLINLCLHHTGSNLFPESGVPLPRYLCRCLCYHSWCYGGRL